MIWSRWLDWPFPDFAKVAFRAARLLARGGDGAWLQHRPAARSGRRAGSLLFPGEDLERIDVALIGEAAKQIDMAAYVLTDSAVIEALRKATERGVKVRIWRDANMAAKVGDFDVRRSSAGGLRALSFGQTRPAVN